MLLLVAAAVLPAFGLDAAATASLCDGDAANWTEWCSSAPTFGGYRELQRRYWGLGLLAYWRPRQLPNFALAAPVLLLCISAVRDYARAAWKHRVRPVWARRGPVEAKVMRTVIALHTDAPGGAPFHRAAVLPFLLCFAALSATMLLGGHVQVTTRLTMASCPAAYWYAAHIIGRGAGGRERVAAALRWWAGGFILVGTAAHANALPWT